MSLSGYLSRIILLTGVFITSPAMASPFAKAAKTIENVPYASVSPSQVMDIYLPEGDGPFPVVVLIHGGAFKMGDKQMEKVMLFFDKYLK